MDVINDVLVGRFECNGYRRYIDGTFRKTCNKTDWRFRFGMEQFYHEKLIGGQWMIAHIYKYCDVEV